ncbi:unnamed protein product [Vicia faba]|uniref:Transmembrane protein n=1 Tax=Vicia faba TaxID=3906 RepID=A0AAV1ASP7_VICFA|nr:unnamed protein product [Vicia faba]
MLGELVLQGFSMLLNCMFDGLLTGYWCLIGCKLWFFVMTVDWVLLRQVCGFSDCKLYACFVVRLVAYVGLSFVYFFSILNSPFCPVLVYAWPSVYYAELCVFLSFLPLPFACCAELFYWLVCTEAELKILEELMLQYRCDNIDDARFLQQIKAYCSMMMLTFEANHG